MRADLQEKVQRYRELLERAISGASMAAPPKSHLAGIGDDFSQMASSYYSDGIYFMENGDPVNALVCFSYGHAWLDAGARLGVFKVSDDVLFSV
ncbi:MAG TPA: DUF357 domain-containing protein [Candidatus Methanoperedenaceae archaeon]|nr:DUF357 domain-containing protein [Candidatus Methanoperedenaceae archaeon]